MQLLCVLLYHARVQRFAGQGDRNWLILANHQTDFDQFFITAAFRGPVYYVALEDLFSNGLLSRIISWLVAPIPFKKASTDARAVMNCIRIAREGGAIALFPEGNRTYSGRTCYINPSVASLAKKLGLPIAIFRIEGGYGIKPRWADDSRAGQMKAGVSRVILPEEYNALSKEELYQLICKELWVDEAAETGSYPSRAAAEHLERVLYVCPDCGLTRFASCSDLLTCTRCGRQHRCLPNKQLQALTGETPYRYVADWYDAQERFIRSLSLTPYLTVPLYRETVALSEVIVYDKKHLLCKNAAVALFGDRLELTTPTGQMALPYREIRAMGCIAGHKLNIFYQDKIYQLKGQKDFNALKYCNIYYRAKHIEKGDPDGEFQFLGL